LNLRRFSGSRKSLQKELPTSRNNVSLVRNAAFNTLQAKGSVGSEGVKVTKDVFKGSIAAAEEVGTGLTVSTKSVAKGIASDVGGDAILTAGASIRGAVKGAAAVEVPSRK